MGVPVAKMLTVGLLPSFAKRWFYRLRGARIGKNVSFGFLSMIDARSIEIGDDSRIGPLSFIKARTLKLGKRVKINMTVAIDTGDVQVDDDSVIMEQVVIGGMPTPRSRISIGKRVKVFPYSFLNPTEPITIEDDVGIGGANYIFTHGSWQSILDGFPVSFGPVTIKKGTWFAWRVFVVPNVTVGEFCTIGAGSIILRDIPPRSLAAGSPAKVLRTGDEYVKKLTLEDKDEIVRDILADFEEFLKSEGYDVRRMATPESVQLAVGSKNIEYRRGWAKPPPVGVDFCVSLEALEAEVSSAIIQNKLSYFDIGGRQSNLSRDPLWQVVRDFFSRYGVRFAVE